MDPGTDNRFTQEFDERSTYKEFRVAIVSRQRGKHTELITSDFILDNTVVYIVQNEQSPEGFEVKGDSRSSVHVESLSPLFFIINMWSKL